MPCPLMKQPLCYTEYSLALADGLESNLIMLRNPGKDEGT